jgi:hypothetical protein
MIYTLLALLITTADFPDNIELKNKQLLTSIDVHCVDNDYGDVICRFESIHYVVADGSCVREEIKDTHRFFQIKPNKWIQVYPDIDNKECISIRDEELELTNKGWTFTIEDRLLGTNPVSCNRFQNKVVYSETDNFTNVLCE